MSMKKSIFFEFLLMFGMGVLLIVSVFIAVESLLLILCCLVLGTIIFIYSSKIGTWWAYLLKIQRDHILIFGEKVGVDESLAKLIFWDFGQNNHWFFKIHSGLALGFTLYHLVRYFVT
jgi:hypothetical protein